MSFIPWHFK